MGRIILILVLLLNTALIRAQVNLNWVENTAGVSVAVDNSHNVYTVNYEYAQGGDITLTKRNQAGQLQWQSSFDQTNSTLWEKATWVETDNAGNIIVTGTLMSGYSNPVVAASIVMKFGPSGNILWRQVFESSFDGSQTKKVLVDEQNNIYILGTGINGSSGLQLKVKKLSPDGTPLWSYFNSIGMPVNMKFTPDNGILVIGRGITGSVNGYAKLDRNGTPIWSIPSVFSTTQGDAAGDAAGNTYIVNLEYIFNPVNSIIKKIGPSGSEIWSASHVIAAQRIEVGTDNMPVICGYPNPNSFGTSFAKFNTAGTLAWSNPDADSTFSLMLHAQLKMDALNNVYLAAGTMTQMAVCKVNSNGSTGWTIAVPGSYANGLDIGTDFSVYVVGGNTSGFTMRIVQAGLTPVTGGVNAAPSDFYLGQNYPNPFNPSTKIFFNLPEDGNVRISVYDIKGSELQTIANGYRKAGKHSVDFDGSNYPSGVYFCRLKSDGEKSYSATIKMILSK